MRLSQATLERLPPDVRRFSYDRDAQTSGIVHFGIGAFHRAHQAWYTDAAMNAGDRDWMITGVSLRSGDVAAQMNPQDGLYSLTERSAVSDAARVIGAVCRVIAVSKRPDDVVNALATPATQIASFTITEKGYCRAADGSLDRALAGRDSVFRFLAEGLAARRDAGLGGLTLISCDNLMDNGRQLARLMREHCDRHDPALGRWIEAECAFPCTMIDRIVPATTAEDRTAAARALGGLEDEAAVVTEPFSQWIIEDHFAGPRPRWDMVGAKLVADVASYEAAKLRMLNGAHSALAYLGIERGHEFVHQAMADPELSRLAGQLMLDEAAPTIVAGPGQNLRVYAADLLARFANPALNHRLSQIAMDGSQKISQRWLATLSDNRRMGRDSPVIINALAAWLRHSRGDNGPVDDPCVGSIAALWTACDLTGVVDALFGDVPNECRIRELSEDDRQLLTQAI